MYTRIVSLFTGCLALAVTTVALADVATPSSADAQRRAQTINNALAMAVPVRQRVEYYRQHHDTFPANNVEAALAPATTFANGDVKSIAVAANGAVEITLTGNSGVDNGVIVLTPSMPKNSDNNVVDWKCASASYATISDDTLGVCEYSKLP
jgi:hypothetical protein